MKENLDSIFEEPYSKNTDGTAMFMRSFILWHLPPSYGMWFRIMEKFEIFWPSISQASKVQAVKQRGLEKSGSSNLKRNQIICHTLSFEWRSFVLDGLEFGEIQQLITFPYFFVPCDIPKENFSLWLWKTISWELNINQMCLWDHWSSCIPLFHIT